MMNLINNTYHLLLDASFWLVIGLFIGGLFKTLIPTAFLHQHLSNGGFSSILKAAILGAPLPLCSCGVIPAAMGLRDAGASKPATTSFLVSTPETGVDSVFITYAMMGPFMAITRPIVAVISAITTGTLVEIFDAKGNQTAENTDVLQQTCCASEPQVIVDCCDADHQHQHESINHEKSILQKIIEGVIYAFTDLFDNIIMWLAVGIIVAAVVQTFVPSDLLITYGAGWIGMLIMLVVGIPMYVCATASTPLAASFLMAGVSPGAVLVFLMAGPATNMATLGVINKLMGKKTMILYLVGIMSTALISGFTLNWLVSIWDINIVQHLSAGHGHVPRVLQVLSFILLMALGFRNLLDFIKQKKSNSNVALS